MIERLPIRPSLRSFLALGAATSLLVAPSPGRAQAGRTGDRPPSVRPAGSVLYDTALYAGLRYRMVGPTRGGRVQTVAGHPGQPFTFYMGATGGGVWKTTDAGQTWKPISDEAFAAGSIGAIAVAPSDPQVVWVGTGEVDIRGNASAGRGLYRSTDGGRSWSFVGLADAGQIGDIEVDPRDPDRAFVAVLGDVFGPSPTRGVFRTEDGGRSWKKVLFVSDSTGVVSLAMDPSNGDVLYAGTWAVARKPWAILSGNREGGIYKTTDGGEHWSRLAGGLPTGLVGKIGVDISRARPDRVWAIIEAPRPDGAVYRSDDAGQTWRKVGTDPRLQQRPYYFHHIFAHPTDPNTVYVTGFRFYESVDGGRTWGTIRTPHGDNRALWINPERPEIMVEGSDGGATVTVDGGKSWSTLLNQPTAQFYRVIVDDRFPYRLYGAQQDNSTISVPAWSARGATSQGLWREVGGCESGHIAVHPKNPDIVYSGCYHGEIDRYDMSTGLRRQVIPYAQAQEGQAASALKYRFQWNSPIVLDPQHPDELYHTSQVVHRSTDGGQSWTVISPDLTYADSARLAFPSPTITRDLTGVEVYGTIFALTPSPLEDSTIWAGTDDGRVWITRNEGADWKEITPQGLPKWSTVNAIEASPHAAGKAYVTVYRYRMDDFRPYVYRTTDYGAHWTRIADGTRGIPPGYPTRVVREDPVREGLLYAGTEYGAFVSFDDGGHWQTLQENLPVVPVTDLVVHGTDLVVATQGRSFWILDDVKPLRQITDSLARAASGAGGRVFYSPRAAWRTRVQGFYGEVAAPEPPPRGAIFDWYFGKAPAGEVTLTIADSAGRVVRRFTSDTARDGDYEGGRRGPDGRPRWEADTALAGAGPHRFAWDLRHAAVDHPKGVFVWGSLGAPSAVPGQYRATLSADGWSETRSFRVREDPRVDATQADLQAQLQLGVSIRDTLNTLYDGVRDVQDVRAQIRDAVRRLAAARPEADTAGVRAAADSLTSTLSEIENELTQTKSKAYYGMAANPPSLDTELAYVLRTLTAQDSKPTQGVTRRWSDLLPRWRDVRERLGDVLGRRVPAFARRLAAAGLEPVAVPVSSGSRP
jgi:photosystem II stability/assembly factor-like uncharacterized protein